MIVKIDKKKVSKALKRRMKLAPKAVRRGMIRGAQRGRTHIVLQTPKDRGQAKAAWRVRPKLSNTREPAILHNTAPYIGVLEEGARPHSVSPEGWAAIYEWVRRHFVFTQTKRGGTTKPRRVTGGIGADPVLTEITWGIVKKLKEKGQDGLFFVKNELPVLQRDMGRAIDGELKKFSGQEPPR